MNGYCITYADANGNIDVTFFGKVLTSLKNISEIEMVRMMFFNAHPTWQILNMRSCSFDEFRTIARAYG